MAFDTKQYATLSIAFLISCKDTTFIPFDVCKYECTHSSGFGYATYFLNVCQSKELRSSVVIISILISLVSVSYSTGSVVVPLVSSMCTCSNEAASERVSECVLLL